MMTIEDTQLVEAYLEKDNDEVKATAYLSIAAKYGGPKKTHCWCKTANIKQYINEFLTWYSTIK